MAEKQINKDRMREIVDSIENGIKELFESDKYRKYLATMSRFHRYSVNNTMVRRSLSPEKRVATPRRSRPKASPMRSASITALKREKTASAISPHGQRARS